MGKFNPASANRSDFTSLFNAWKNNDIITDTALTAALNAYHAAYISPITQKCNSKYDPCYDEVVEARGGYESLDARLDAIAGGGGATDYDELDNRPKINSVTLTGNKSLADLGIAAAADLATKAAASDLTAESTARAAADTKHEAILALLVDGKSKNLLDLSQLSSTTTQSGVTWTVDPDAGTIRAQCPNTVSSNTFFYIWQTNTNYPASEAHFLSGCPSGGGQTVYNLQTAIGSTVYRDTGDGIEVPAGTYRYVAIGVYQGQSNVDLTFRPMLCLKKEKDASDAFVPFYPQLSDMWAAIRALQASIASASVQSTRSSSQLMSIRPDVDLTEGSEVPEDA